MKTKILATLSFLAALTLVACEVKETNNYHLVEDPLLQGRIGTNAGYWTVGKELILVDSPNNKSLNVPNYTTGVAGNHRIGALLTNKGASVVTFEKGTTGIDVFEDPYFAIAIGEVVRGKFTGTAYDMSKKNENETQDVDDLTLTFKHSYPISMDFGLAEEESTYETKLGVKVDFDTLGKYQGEFKRLDKIASGSIKNGDRYKCWLETDGHQVKGGAANTNGLPFTFSYDEATKKISFNHDSLSAGALGNDCKVFVDLEVYGVNDPGVYKASGKVQECVTNQPASNWNIAGPKVYAHSKYLHANDYSGLALAYDDKRFTVWMGSATTKKPVVLECFK